MNIQTLPTIIGASLIISGCGGEGGTPGVIGENSNFETALAETEAFADLEIVPAIDEGVTAFVDLPETTNAFYNGYIVGFAGADGDGPDLDYAANLSATANFEAGTFDGSISGMTTNLAGFESPSGTVDLFGDINDLADGATLDILAAGELTGSSMTADFAVVGEGLSFGADGRAAAGVHTSFFDWTSGAASGTRSTADGVWAAAD